MVHLTGEGLSTQVKPNLLKVKGQKSLVRSSVLPAVGLEERRLVRINLNKMTGPVSPFTKHCELLLKYYEFRGSMCPCDYQDRALTKCSSENILFKLGISGKPPSNRHSLVFTPSLTQG